MKKFITFILIAGFTISLMGCGQNSASDKKSDQTSKTDVTVAENNTDNSHNTELSEDELDAAMDLLVDLDHKKWPKDRVHPDMPEYKKGKLNGWNQWDKSEYSIFMLLYDTSKEDMEEYKAALLTAGFEEVNGSTYRKEIYEVELKMNSDTILQISSNKEEVLSWPKDLADIPAPKKGNLTSVTEPTDEVPDTVQLYYINMTQADIDEWAKELETKGFTVDGNSMSLSNATLRGKNYNTLYVQCQENGTNEWMVDFMYSAE